MLITIAGLAIVVAAALWIAWPILAQPAAAPDASEAAPGAARWALERQRDTALAAIREAEFDHQTGKLSDADYGALRADLETHALAAIDAVDGLAAPAAVEGAPEGERNLRGSGQRSTVGAPQGSAGPRGDLVFCAACGGRNPRTARFCSGCGREMRGAGARGRRRASGA